MRKVLLFVCAVALAATASATTITPGTSNASPSVLNPFPSSFTVVESSTGNSFTGVDASSNAVFQGTFDTAVIKDNSTGYLTFIYQFKTTAGPDSIVRMSTTNFTGFSTDAGYYTDAYFANLGTGSVAPDALDRSSNGSVVGFTFNNGVAPGQTTYLLAIKTNAYGWTSTGSTQFQDGGIASVKSYAPTVPEPATMTLLASGLLMFGVKRFRK
jgi:hypothetical protein